MLVDARRIIGIKTAKEFYELTPNEYFLLFKGAMYAKYDRLNEDRLISSSTKPVVLVNNSEELETKIDKQIDSYKKSADEILAKPIKHSKSQQALEKRFTDFF